MSNSESSMGAIISMITTCHERIDSLGFDVLKLQQSVEALKDDLEHHKAMKPQCEIPLNPQPCTHFQVCRFDTTVSLGCQVGSKFYQPRR